MSRSSRSFSESPDAGVHRIDPVLFADPNSPFAVLACTTSLYPSPDRVNVTDEASAVIRVPPTLWPTMPAPDAQTTTAAAMPIRNPSGRHSLCHLRRPRPRVEGLLLMVRGSYRLLGGSIVQSIFFEDWVGPFAHKDTVRRFGPDPWKANCSRGSWAARSTLRAHGSGLTGARSHCASMARPHLQKNVLALLTRSSLRPARARPHSGQTTGSGMPRRG